MNDYELLNKIKKIVRYEVTKFNFEKEINCILKKNQNLKISLGKL